MVTHAGLKKVTYNSLAFEFVNVIFRPLLPLRQCNFNKMVLVPSLCRLGGPRNREGCNLLLFSPMETDPPHVMCVFPVKRTVALGRGWLDDQLYQAIVCRLVIVLLNKSLLQQGACADGILTRYGIQFCQENPTHEGFCHVNPLSERFFPVLPQQTVRMSRIAINVIQKTDTFNG